MLKRYFRLFRWKFFIAVTTFWWLWATILLLSDSERSEQTIHISSVSSNKIFQHFNKKSPHHPIAPKNNFSYVHYVRGGAQTKEFHRNYFNVKKSDEIGLYRDPPLFFPYKCSEKFSRENYIQKKTVGIIITFVNEARSTLIRTIESCATRSVDGIKIEKIVLIDDFSADERDGKELLEYDHRISLYRNSQREGLIRSRMKGTVHMRNIDIMVFLDSHCECDANWLRPLIESMKDDMRIVASPILNIIDEKTFEFNKASTYILGGIDKELRFSWISMSTEDILRNKKNVVQPYVTPTFAGGIFAIHRQFFLDIGAYDRGMSVWGSENVEISLRIWNCHGKLILVPCSHVSHVFRTQHPYQFPGGGAAHIIKRNGKRLAELWMDSYLPQYYQLNPNVIPIDEEDLTERFELIKQLKCRDIHWFIENVYEEFSKIFNHKSSSWNNSVPIKSVIHLQNEAHCLNQNLEVIDCELSNHNYFFSSYPPSSSSSSSLSSSSIDRYEQLILQQKCLQINYRLNDVDIKQIVNQLYFDKTSSSNIIPTDYSQPFDMARISVDYRVEDCVHRKLTTLSFHRRRIYQRQLFQLNSKLNIFISFTSLYDAQEHIRDYFKNNNFFHITYDGEVKKDDPDHGYWMNKLNISKKDEHYWKFCFAFYKKELVTFLCYQSGKYETDPKKLQRNSLPFFNGTLPPFDSLDQILISQIPSF